MKHIPWRESAWAVGFLVLLLLIYSVTYFATVRRSYAADPARTVIASYRGGLPESLFVPINALDREIRPWYWHWSEGIKRVPVSP